MAEKAPASDRGLQGPESSSLALNMTVGQFLFAQAEQYRDNVCQIDVASERAESYGEVNLRSVRAAIALEQEKQLGLHDLVAVVCSESCPDAAVAVLACSFLGLPVARLHPALPGIDDFLRLLAPVVLLVGEAALDVVREYLRECPDLQVMVLGQCRAYRSFAEWLRPQRGEDTFRPTQVDPHNLACVAVTTASPRAVCHSHRSFLQLVHTLHDSGFAAGTLLHFDSGTWISPMMVLACCFMDGATRVCHGQSPDSGKKILQLVQTYKPDVLLLLPTDVDVLAEIKSPKAYNVTSLRRIVVTGTTVDPGKLETLSKNLKDVDVVFCYGLAEVGLITAFHPERERTLLRAKLGSCGKAVPGTVVKVTDLDSGDSVGPNARGEIRVKSSSLMAGYHGSDCSHSFDKQGFFRTSDVGYFDDDDCLYVTQRLDDVFRYKESYVMPADVEAALVRHPAVREAVVFGTPHGEKGEAATAWVVLKPNAKTTEDEIRKYVEERVRRHERLKGGVRFVPRLPKNFLGQVLRREIRETEVGERPVDSQ